MQPACKLLGRKESPLRRQPDISVIISTSGFICDLDGSRLRLSRARKAIDWIRSSFDADRVEARETLRVILHVLCDRRRHNAGLAQRLTKARLLGHFELPTHYHLEALAGSSEQMDIRVRLRMCCINANAHILYLNAHVPVAKARSHERVSIRLQKEVTVCFNRY